MVAEERDELGLRSGCAIGAGGKKYSLALGKAGVKSLETDEDLQYAIIRHKFSHDLRTQLAVTAALQRLKCSLDT
jgi:hypothetical protein